MLQVSDLSHHSSRKKRLISNISLTFAPGMIYGVLGPNGSGKSTLLKTIMGICRPSSGTVCWQSENLHQMGRREISRVLSLVPQGIPLYFDFSVQDIVAMGRYAHSTSHVTSTSMIEWALKQTHVWELRHQPVSTLSSGERQLAYIARALATEAPVMLLDEPTANLDIRHQLGIWKLLKSLASQGKVIIVANHDLQTSENFCDQVALLDQGRCVGMGTFTETITPQVLNAIFGVPADYQFKPNFALHHA